MTITVRTLKPLDPWAALDQIAHRQARPYVPPAELPLGQMMVLLKLRPRDVLAQKVLASLEAMGAPEPGKADWRALIETRHLARLPKVTALKGEAITNQGPLQLTPVTGLQAARDVANMMAAKLGIHFLTYGRAQGNHGHSVRCTCGWGSYSSASFTGQANVGGHAGMHMRQVQDGTLLEAYRIPRFKVEVVDVEA